MPGANRAVNRVNPRKNSYKRTPFQQQADMLLFERLSLQGWTSYRIAEYLPTIRPYRLSGSMIQYDLNVVKRRWRAEASALIDEHVAKTLAGLQRQEDELWAAWDRSQKDAESETRETIEIKKGRGKKTKKVPGEKITKTRTGQVGGVQFQNALLEIARQKRELFGLDQPKKIASTTPDGKNSAPMVVCVTAEEMPVAKKIE